MRQLELSAHASPGGGRHVPEDLAKVQLSELYPLAHLVVGNPKQRQPMSGLTDLYGDWPRP